MNKTLKKLKKIEKKSDCADRNSVITIGIMDLRSEIHKSDQQLFFFIRSELPIFDRKKDNSDRK